MTRDLKVIAVALISMGSVSAASAQVYPRPPAPIDMPPHEVRTIVRSTGLTPAGPPVRRGQHYVQPALDPYGRPMRVVVDSAAGAVVSITPATVSAGYRPATAHPPAPPYVRYGMTPPRDFEDDDDLDMVPPRPVPGARAPTAVIPPPPPPPREQLAARPPAKPVPRPRPATAPRDPAVAAVKEAAPATTASVPPEAKPVEAKPEPAPAAAAPAAEPKQWENEFPQFAPLE
jgi:hypothetical protein